MVRRPPLSKAEMQVARVLWELGSATVRQVHEAMASERKIDFTLISSERAPRNVGKTAREKAKKSTSGKPGGRRRQVGKQVNFEPDSAFRKEKETARPKKEKKAKKPSAKTQKIAAATKVVQPGRCPIGIGPFWQ